MTGIDRAYSTFLTEASRFTSADGIDKSLRTALYFARAANALSEVGDSSATVQTRLQITASRLSQAYSLMVPGSNITADAHALVVAAPVIGSADTRSSASFAPVVAPSSVGTIMGDPNQSPLSTQTISASQTVNGKLPYELAGVSVTVAGRAAQVLSVSPSKLSFVVPAGLPAVDTEVIVTSQAGYVSRGVVTVAPIALGIFTKSGNGTGDAVVMDSNGLTSGPFDVNMPYTSSQDKRNRLIIYTTGLCSGLNDSDASNNLTVYGISIPNLAESIGVEARTASGQVFNLKVEYAGTQGSWLGLDQVNVILPPELKGAGTVELTLVAGSLRSNIATVNIK